MTTRVSLLAWILSMSVGCSSPGDGPVDGGDADGGADGSITTDGSSTTDGDTTKGLDTPGGLSKRASDPIVMVGGEVPSFGTALTKATDVVGFVRKAGAWQQLAIQIDERYRAEFCKVYGNKLSQCASAKPIETIFYADPSTFTGADPDPTFDLDDELVFMARDAGDRAAPGGEPGGVRSGSGVEIELTDGTEKAYVYLFERGSTSLSPDAKAAHLVTYAFGLQDGAHNPIDYKTQYPVKGDADCTGPNLHCNPPSLEDTLVTAGAYTRHFATRWVTDALHIKTAGAQDKDILDCEQAKFSPGFCGRNVLTFSTAEGAFVANIEGPIRVIRSYLGANSGPYTERTHFFYEASEVEHTFLRVHAIPSVMNLVDYAPEATGMTYYNSKNTGGLAIDGAPDTFDSSVPDWELLSGPYGSIVTTVETHRSADVAALPLVWYWEDQKASTNDQCQLSQTVDVPDADAFGTVGPYVLPPAGGMIPVTDPARTTTPATLMFSRTNTYGAASLKVVDAEAIAARVLTPIGHTARTFGSTLGADCGDGNCAKFTGTCGDGLCDPWEDSVGCAADCNTGATGGAICGDTKCDASEDALGCPLDCWKPTASVGTDFVTCATPSCAISLQACEYLAGCVALTVCVTNCEKGGMTLAACQTSCLASVTAPGADKLQAKQLIMCASGAGCL